MLEVTDAAALTEVKRRLHTPCLPAAASPAVAHGLPGSVRLVFPKAENAARLIEIEAPDVHHATIYLGLRLWQRCDPVEAARWPILLGKAAFSSMNMPKNMIRASQTPAAQTMKLVLQGGHSATRAPFTAILPNSNDPAAWAERHRRGHCCDETDLDRRSAERRCQCAVSSGYDIEARYMDSVLISAGLSKLMRSLHPQNCIGFYPKSLLKPDRHLG